MEGLGHGATGSKPGSMWQIVAATKPPEPCLRRGAGFMPGACALMASDSPCSLFEVLPCLFSAIQAGGALAAAGRTVRKRATAAVDLDEETAAAKDSIRPPAGRRRTDSPACIYLHRCWHVPSLTLLGPNVRHERRRKGCEAGFGTSARWRG